LAFKGVQNVFFFQIINYLLIINQLITLMSAINVLHCIKFGKKNDVSVMFQTVFLFEKNKLYEH